MIYRVYPIVLGGSTALLTIAGFAATYAFTTSRWPLVFIPFVAVFAGFLIVSVLCSRYPRIRFVNEAEIDGLGYVHQPLDAILPVFLFGISSALLILIRG
jgi:zinc transporter ZupT